MTVIDKITALKKEIEEELEKEEPNQYLINKIKNKIIGLGISLTQADINKQPWTNKQ